MTAEFDVSAQFGGKDAAQAVLPHFRALKAAAKAAPLRDFPRRKLAFILRVDGEVNKYGLSGVGKVDVDAGGEYVSVDIGCTVEDRARLEETISGAILASPEAIRDTRHKGLEKLDFDSLAVDIAVLVARYRESLPGEGQHSG